MLILACDTSGSNCSAALMKDEVLLGEYNMNYGKQHSVLLMPLIEELLDQTGTKPCELTQLCVNLGPGSFTGLRIGLSVMEAMSYALSIPLYGYTSFQACAEPLGFHEGEILVLHDALKKTFYSAAFCSESGGLGETLSPDVRDLSELKDRFGDGTGLVIGGDALAKHAQDISSCLPRANIAPDSVIQRASALARLCRRDVLNGVPPEPVTLPRYMRKPQAQREYEAKHGHDLD